MIPIFLLLPVLLIVACAIVGFAMWRSIITRRMAIATAIITACYVVGYLAGGLAASLELVDGSVGRGARVHLVMLLSCALMLLVAPLPLRRWPLSHIALGPIPIACFILYITVSVYSGAYSFWNREWWETLFDRGVYTNWFGPLMLFLVVPWFFGIGIVAIIRLKTKTAATQSSEATR